MAKGSVAGRFVTILAVLLVLAALPLSAAGQEYKIFSSPEYGFTMKYPASWVKIDNPKGNYYKVFQAPDLSDNFRNRVNVAAHKPVTDSIDVLLQEFRNAIKDLQKPAAGQTQEAVRLVDEGEFKCDVPGAHYFFVQALEDKLNIWMDIVIVYYKSNQTLVRVSCLTSSKAMETMHKAFNDVLVSLKFTEEAGEPPMRPSAVQPPAPGAPEGGPRPVERAPAPPAAGTQPPGYGPAPASPGPPAAPMQPSGAYQQPAPAPRPPVAGPAPAPAPPSAPRGPSRQPRESPGPGMVE